MRGGALVGAAVAALCLVVLVTSPAAAAGGDVVLDTTVNGARLSSASSSHPVRLDPAGPATISLRVTNGGRSTIAVRSLSFAGEVIGLTFFAYQTSVLLSVPPGQTGTLQFPLDLSGLDGQATGLMPASMTVYDRSHNRLASEATVVDVRGSIRSVYGLFGLGIAILTAFILVSLLTALARQRLPDNRWRRALRFVPLGAGVALVAAFTLSVARLFVPTVAHVLPVLAVAVAVTFGIGYLTPAPGGGTPEAPVEPDEEDEAEAAREPAAVEHHTIGHAVATGTRGATGTAARARRPRPSTGAVTRGPSTGMPSRTGTPSGDSADETPRPGTGRVARSSTRSTRRTPPP
jgi:hypothetical protein